MNWTGVNIQTNFNVSGKKDFEQILQEFCDNRRLIDTIIKL